jgi:hypothetical protein
METTDKCETCAQFKEHKIFGKDGICYQIPSKPRFVGRYQTCRYHRKRKESSAHGRKDT